MEVEKKKDSDWQMQTPLQLPTHTNYTTNLPVIDLATTYLELTPWDISK